MTTLDQSMSDAPNCGITFKIVIETLTKARTHLYYRHHSRQSSYDDCNIFIVQPTGLPYTDTPAKNFSDGEKGFITQAQVSVF
jgi:hypothetical protein